MMKKYISLFLMFCVSFSLVSPTLASEDIGYIDYYQEEIQAAAEDLQSVSGGEKLQQQIDLFFEKNSSNTQMMYTLEERLWEVQEKLYTQEVDPKTEAIVNYLTAKVYLEVEKIYLQEKKDLEEKQSKKVEEILATNLSLSENRKVEKEILKLQKNMFEYSNETIEKILGDFEKYTKVQENGDFSVDISIEDTPIFGQGVSGNMQLNIDNYQSTTNMFDSQFNGNLTTNISSQNNNGENLDIQGQAYFDLIQKDGIMYFYVDDVALDISGDSTGVFEEIETMIQQVQDFSAEKKYIKIGDESIAEVFQTLQGLQPEQLFGVIQVATEIPFFEAYKKQGNSYILRPTKHLCSTLKDIAGKFDPFFGGACSEKQYETFLGEYVNMGAELSLEISGTQNTLSYSTISDITTVQADIVYDSSEVSAISIEVIPNQEMFPGEGMNFAYEKGRSLSFEMSVEEVEMFLESVLTVDNKMYSIQGAMSMNGEQIGYLQMENGDFQAGIDYVTQRYDWGNDEYTDSGEFSMNMHGVWNGQGFDVFEMNGDYTDYQYDDENISFALNYGQEPDSIQANITVGAETPVFVMDMSGIVMSDYADLQIRAEIQESPTGKFDLDIVYDLRNNAANADIQGALEISGENVVDFSMENTGTRKYFEGEIVAPKEYIDIEELMNEERYY